MFGKKQQAVGVKSAAQLADELNTAMKAFVTEWVDARIPAGLIYDTAAVPRVFVQHLFQCIHVENLKRLPQNAQIMRTDCVPVKFNGQARVETRRDTRTPAERAAALRRKQIEDNTAVPVD